MGKELQYRKESMTRMPLHRSPILRAVPAVRDHDFLQVTASLNSSAARAQIVLFTMFEESLSTPPAATAVIVKYQVVGDRSSTM